MLGPGMRLGVAVSGGADSVCLLHVLLELAPRWDLRLVVLHLDHRLRGAESEADAAFVRDLAARLGLPVSLRAGRVWPPLPAISNRPRGRRAWPSIAKPSPPAKWTASPWATPPPTRPKPYSTASSAAQATAGLAGIRPVTSDGIIRPLIAVDRCEVEQYLRDRSIAWRVDSTNRNPQFARNRIRHLLLPHLARDWNPAIGHTLAHMADWALAEQDYWEAEMDRLAAQHLVEARGAILVRADTLAGMPLAAARRLVRRAIERVKGDLRGIDFTHVAAALEIALRSRGNGRCAMPGVEIRRSFQWLRFSRAGAGCPDGASYRIPAAVPGIVRLPGADFAISMELIEKKETSTESAFVYNEEIGCLDWCGLSGPLEFRNWRPGDRYQPVQSAGEQKIKTLFQKACIPSWDRGLWPILTDGVSILWTRRFGAAARFAANAGSQVVLVIREIRV